MLMPHFRAKHIQCIDRQNNIANNTLIAKINLFSICYSFRLFFNINSSKTQKMINLIACFCVTLLPLHCANEHSMNIQQCSFIICEKLFFLAPKHFCRAENVNSSVSMVFRTSTHTHNKQSAGGLRTFCIELKEINKIQFELN